MNPAVECAERGDYKGFWEACDKHPEDWLTAYWRAMCLHQGYGCEKNIAEASRVANEIVPAIIGLAEQNDVVAQHKLGVLLDRGCGVAENEALSAKWYSKAAEQGYAKAQFNLALMYANGRGVEKDESKTVEWYRRASEQGNARA